MATKVTKIIGSGGDYADWPAFSAACPADLVALDQQWDVKIKKGALSQAGTYTFTTKTTDATRYFNFMANDAEAWYNDANVRNLPFISDAARGAAFLMTGANAYGFNCQVNYTRFNGLQFINSNNGVATGSALYIPSNIVGCEVNNCIIDAYGHNTSVNAAARLAGSTIARNTLIVQRSSDPTAYIVHCNNGSKFYNCTAVSLNVKSNIGMYTANLASTFKNLGVFNVVKPENDVVPATKTNCITDATATGWTTAPYSAATFTSVNPSAPDFRYPAGSALIDAGTSTAADGVTTDATGLARPVGAAYDNGAWEYQAAAADTTAPILSGAAGTATSATTASATVSTNEAGGLLYYMASINATETAATIKAASSQVVTATGAQSVTFTGLTAGTTYYSHFVQVDAAGNTSNVANGTGFTTPAVDAQAPTWPNGAAITPGAITSSSVAFSYPTASDNVGVHHYETSKDNGATWQNNGTGTTGQFTGLPSSTAIPLAVCAVDAQGNRSALLTLSMTTSAGAAGSFKTSVLENNAGTKYAAGTAVVGQWHQGGRVGSAPTGITYVTGTVAADGTVSFTGLPTGAGYLLAAVRGASVAADKPYYETGTVA